MKWRNVIWVTCLQSCLIRSRGLLGSCLFHSVSAINSRFSWYFFQHRKIIHCINQIQCQVLIDMYFSLSKSNLICTTHFIWKTFRWARCKKVAPLYHKFYGITTRYAMLPESFRFSILLNYIWGNLGYCENIPINWNLKILYLIWLAPFSLDHFGWFMTIISQK